MMKTKPNDSINAYVMLDGQGEAGLTKREYFASIAMQGLSVYFSDVRACSERAVNQADALIEELNKTNND